MSNQHLATSLSSLGILLSLGAISPLWAQENPEDAPIEDEPLPLAPVSPKPAPIPPTPTIPTTPPSGAPSGASDTVTIPRSVWEQLLRDVEELKANHSALAAPAPVSPGAAPANATPGTATPATGTETATNRNYLLLPDISVIGNIQGLASSDKRDEGRNTIETEGEIGIQGYVYPNVKYDTYIVGNPGEDEFGVEEGFLTYLGARRGLNVQIGRKFAPFGRTGELHPHSWLYSRQVLARQNLVAGEALVGNGINLNYLLPTGKKFFARVSLGAFSGGEAAGGRVNTSDPSDPFEGSSPSRIGAGLSRFYNGRLWLGTSIGEKNEIELGFSRAQGRAFVENLSGVDVDGNEIVAENAGRLNLTGVDFSLRRYVGEGKRLLLRGEYFRYNPRNLPTVKGDGYYLLSNYRLNRFNDFGLLHEKSDFANAPGAKETATSLIYTRNFNERYYLRLMGTRGDRPGESNYSEGRIQFVVGLGPHTHELE